MEQKPTETTPATPAAPVTETPATQPAVPTPTPAPETPANAPTPSTTPTPSEASVPPTPSTPSQETTPAAPSEKHMGFPIKTVLLILMLAILAGILVMVAWPKSKSSQTAMMHPTPTISPAHTVLALSQQTATGSGTVLAITADTGINKITGVQFEIAYDPTVVSNVIVTPGDFLAQPTVLLNTVDNKNGRISYAAVLSPTAPAVTGTGTVATISYTLAPATATTRETTFKFLPKSKVTEDSTLDSVLKSAKDLTLPLPGADKLPTNSPH